MDDRIRFHIDNFNTDNFELTQAVMILTSEGVLLPMPVRVYHILANVMINSSRNLTSVNQDTPVCTSSDPLGEVRHFACRLKLWTRTKSWNI